MTEVTVQDQGPKYIADVVIGGLTGLFTLAVATSDPVNGGVTATLVGIACAALGGLGIERYTRTGNKNPDGSDEHLRGEAHALFAAGACVLAWTYGPGGFVDQKQETAALETTGSEYVQVVDAQQPVTNTKVLTAKVA